MEPPEGCPTGITRLMNDAWTLEPDQRPSFSEALERLKHVHSSIISVTMGMSS